MEAAEQSSHFFLCKKISLLVKQDGLCQTCQDPWYVNWYYFSDHLWKADLGGEWLSLDEKVKCKLMELLYRLKPRENIILITLTTGTCLTMTQETHTKWVLFPRMKQQILITFCMYEHEHSIFFPLAFQNNGTISDLIARFTEKCFRQIKLLNWCCFPWPPHLVKCNNVFWHGDGQCVHV